MATYIFFKETIQDQVGENSLEIEFGRSSASPEDSIYLTVDGKTVTMNRATAKRFVDAVIAVGQYHSFVD